MQIGELFVALGFDVDDKKLKEFNDGIKTATLNVGKMATIALGALYALDRFVAGSVRAATELRNFSAETGNSFEALQKWQVASTLTNAAATADQVTSSFRAMATAIADVTMGNGPSGAFAMLGIGDVRGRSVDSVLEELRKNFEGNVARWGYGQTVNLMKEVGIDANMLQALRLTTDEFERLTQGRYLDQASVDRLVRLGNTINDVKQQWILFKDQFAANNADRIGSFFTNVSFGVLGVAKAMEQLFIFAQKAEGPLKAVFAILIGAAAGIGILAGGWTALATAAIVLLASLDRLGEWFQNNQAFFDDMQKLGKTVEIPWLREWASNVRARGQERAEERGIQDPNRFGNFFRGLDVLGEESRAREMMGRGLGGVDKGASTGGWIDRPNVTQNNTYNIQGVDDPNALSGAITRDQQRQINGSFSEFNNGPRY